MTREDFYQQLQWLVQAPPLLPAAPFKDVGQLLQTLAQQEPKALLQAAEVLVNTPRQSRLGAHFEALVAALIEASQRFELVARNLRLQTAERTLGELDMLVEDRQRGKLMHWELAIKFYLGYQGHWLGPNSRDTLARKSRHLFEQQLPRSQSPAIRSWLQQQGLNIDEQHLLLRGRLFYPDHQSSCSSTPMPDPAHERGWWTPATALNAGNWSIIDRHYWPSPLVSDKSTNIVATPALLDYVQSTAFPRMVYAHHSNTIGFVVPSSWPQHDKNNPHPPAAR